MRSSNKAIDRKRHSTPTINELMNDLHGATVFSKLDLNQGYNQVFIAIYDFIAISLHPYLWTSAHLCERESCDDLHWSHATRVNIQQPAFKAHREDRTLDATTPTLRSHHQIPHWAWYYLSRHTPKVSKQSLREEHVMEESINYIATTSTPKSMTVVEIECSAEHDPTLQAVCSLCC